MKKLALILALLMIVSVFAVACNSGENNGEDATTTTTKKTTTTTTRRQDPVDPDDGKDEVVVPDLISGDRFTLDGDLADWEGIKTIGVIGEAAANCKNSENKKVTFYGALTDKGLFLACDTYHDTYQGASTTWYENCNFEFFIGEGKKLQYYVFARGIGEPCSTSATELQAVMNTVKIDQGTVYHTIVEAFIATEDLPEEYNYYNTYDVGVAWKTAGEDIVGGMGVVREGADDWWVPKGSWPNDGRKAVVAPSGIYLQEDYTY